MNHQGLDSGEGAGFPRPPGCGKREVENGSGRQLPSGGNDPVESVLSTNTI